SITSRLNKDVTSVKNSPKTKTFLKHSLSTLNSVFCKPFILRLERWVKEFTPEFLRDYFDIFQLEPLKNEISKTIILYAPHLIIPWVSQIFNHSSTPSRDFLNFLIKSTSTSKEKEKILDEIF